MWLLFFGDLWAKCVTNPQLEASGGNVSPFFKDLSWIPAFTGMILLFICMWLCCRILHSYHALNDRVLDNKGGA